MSATGKNFTHLLNRTRDVIILTKCVFVIAVAVTSCFRYWCVCKYYLFALLK